MLRAPGHRTFLFDAGSLVQKDIGRRIVSAYLDYRGISALEAIVASHNDTDHINGIPEILQHCRVNHIYAPAIMIEQAHKDQGPAPWLESYLQMQDRTLERFPATPRADESPDSGLSIEQLWPVQGTATPRLSDNNASLVLLITYHHRTILITSDIEQGTQQRLMTLYPDLQPDILLAPHHGSLTTLYDRFLSHLSPKTILCSCGASAFKRGRVIATPTTFHTPRHGAITVTMPRRGRVTMEAWLSTPLTADESSVEDAL